MIRLGLIDHELDNYHANTYLALARTRFAERVTVAGCWALQGASGRAWAERNDLAWYDDPARLAPEVDAWAVLAPADPGLHPQLCALVLPSGKPTFVDKTFASDLATAKAIFALADRHHAPIQTSSALRTTNVQRAVAAAGEAPRHVAAWGGGRSFGEYAIHPLELAVSLLGPEAVSLQRRGDAAFDQLLIGLTGGRTATVNVHCGGSTPFAAAITTATTTRWLAVDTAPLFHDAFAAMLDFLVSGMPTVDRRESLAIRALLDAAEDPRARQAAVEVAS
jgi:predicted dehydrogenase